MGLHRNQRWRRPTRKFLVILGEIKTRQGPKTFFRSITNGPRCADETLPRQDITPGPGHLSPQYLVLGAIRYTWLDQYPSAQGCQSIPVPAARAKDTDRGRAGGKGGRRAGTPLAQEIHFALLHSLFCPVKPGEGVRQEVA